jgi:hypothetical protein
MRPVDWPPCRRSRLEARKPARTGGFSARPGTTDFWPGFGSFPGGMKDGFPVSVAELIAGGARPLPSEAVAIVLDVCEQVTRQPVGGSVLPAITPSVLFVDGSGCVALSGGVPVEDDQTVQLLGRLLMQMLPPSGTSGAVRVPSRLRSLAMRAAAGELPRLSVGRLAASLRRFAPERPRAAVRDLFERWRGGNRSSSTGAELALNPFVVHDEALFGEIDDEPAGVMAASPAASQRGARRSVVGALVVVLLVLAGVGATYWLDAEDSLPPIPLDPGLLLTEPPAPARSDWELLDPAGLAVEALPLDPASRLSQASVGFSTAKREGGGQAEALRMGRPMSESGYAHRPDHRP